MSYAPRQSGRDDARVAVPFVHPGEGGCPCWKTYSWEITDRLFERGRISDSKRKAKSVWLTEEGARMSEELFQKHFAARDPGVATKTTE